MAKTPERVTTLLKLEIPAKISLNQFCKKTGINPNSVDKYMAGVTEPTQASIEKLSKYFDRSAVWLRGEGVDERRFGQADWDDTRDMFEDILEQTKDLMELYSLSPDHLKNTVISFLDSLRESLDGIVITYSNEFSEKEIEEIKNVVAEADKVLAMYYTEKPDTP